MCGKTTYGRVISDLQNLTQTSLWLFHVCLPLGTSCICLKDPRKYLLSSDSFSGNQQQMSLLLTLMAVLGQCYRAYLTLEYHELNLLGRCLKCTSVIRIQSLSHSGDHTGKRIQAIKDDVIKWKHFPLYWPFVRGIHRSPVKSLQKASDAELWCFHWYVPE